ncbi:nuclear transport factor 2 family protein [Autumnicola edwardsiae]|uniref:Nuclear transport factor 2 family protein n=1 Tax=Autumnicola edwardsiae TaxID=3075594 RepID=A0ABU3CT72_9FLAO|nr:nuclear transport factor 2 family protein [Zunongwangia sp. F297]MDT0649559.1 nuclear transport factor 2 family protein [Zunongwangia sp. F297]
MKSLVTILFLIFFGINFTRAQEDTISSELQSEEDLEAQNKDAAVKLVKDFFEKLHEQDTVALRKFAHPDIVMRSVAIDTAGNTTVNASAYSEFLKSIASIPRTTNFEERLHSIAVHASGELASVLTPYSVYVNEQLRHCGVNSFQLIKVGEEYKIIYLMDTRKKEGCAEFEAQERQEGETKTVIDEVPKWEN